MDPDSDVDLLTDQKIRLYVGWHLASFSQPSDPVAPTADMPRQWLPNVAPLDCPDRSRKGARCGDMPTPLPDLQWAPVLFCIYEDNAGFEQSPESVRVCVHVNNCMQNRS
ncbi:unnamed protein product [Protopolystoma xenopodis]|uniref:Uncharacterized protein n=1 Tax=Protopolystoma xenopodis TaxID=117903 RepID=A0A3S5BY00_9PLAT|nr:unnamed protein product [Protopolystoma xenopodis]